MLLLSLNINGHNSVIFHPILTLFFLLNAPFFEDKSNGDNNARKLQRERREKINEKKEGDGQPKMRTATVSNKPSTAAKSGVIDEFSDSDVHSQSESESVPPSNIHGSF